MTTQLRNFWQNLTGRSQTEAPVVAPPPAERVRPPDLILEIAPNDPIIGYFQSAPGAVEVDKLHLASPALRALKEAGVKMVVPLVGQGELIGLLNLGPRLSEQDYSTDDRTLINNLATQAAPALRVAQLVRQQQIEAQARERLEQELRVARLIQQTLLPKELPTLPGWHVAAYYQPARAVGGDFYDFVYLSDGRLGLIIGDVTGKGVPAALVMATTRAILRGQAQRLASPGEVLEHTNELLVPDIPRNMFVTCLYAVLNPATGRMQYANAGHDLPYRRYDGGVDELRATGMPLGLLPGMGYEEKEVQLNPGESVLFYSDGLVEAHNPHREMFGFPRLGGLIGTHPGGAGLIDFLLGELVRFTGPEWEQEDDTTLVILQRAKADNGQTANPSEKAHHPQPTEGWRTVTEFSLPSEAGNEREAMKKIAAAAQLLQLPANRLERLKTAVAEATMNAIEHGNKYRAELPVGVQLLASDTALAVRITDQGGNQPIAEKEKPDLDAKLAGLQTPRGWGLFLIKNMVDEMNVTTDESHHTVELILHLTGEGDQHGRENA
jgi:serine phosphatase RsbU (regulator of sigma subunit)/anti-sigma regulatory factor (Ser/Thr protein kinase)